MLFKRLITLTSLSTVLLTGSAGCGLLGESVADFSSNNQNISASSSCMTDSMTTLGKFFTGEAGQIQVNGAWVCIDESLDLFSKKVRGENPGYYKAREIGSFLENQVMDQGSHISDASLAEILRLKQLLVGGDSDKLTLQELTDLRTMAGHFKVLFFELQPYMKIFSGTSEFPGMTTEQAVAQLRDTEIQFVKTIKANWPNLASSYNLQNLKTLASSLKKDFPNTSAIATFDEWTGKYLPLILNVKKIALNSTDDYIRPQDWGRILNSLPNLYARFLHYKYFLADQPSLFWGESLTALKSWLADLSGNLKNTLINRGNGNSLAITQTELASLIDSLGIAEILPEAFGPGTLKPLVPVILGRFLTLPSQRLAGKKETTLSLKVIENFESEITLFHQAQKKLDDLYKIKSKYSHAELRTALSGATGAQEELFRIFQLNGSYGFDGQSRMFISADSELPYDQASALKASFIRAMVRVFIRGYAKDLTRANGAVSLAKDEVLVDAWTELRPALVQANLIDPDNEKFAKNRFIEANLFTPPGNGDAFIDFRETSGIAFMIWSGKNLSAQFHEDLKKSCMIAGSNPNLYKVSCVLERYRVLIPTIATNLPLMAQHLQALAPPAAAEMLFETFRATGWKANPEGTARLNDLDLTLHLLQYMESIYRRWDTNKDRTLNKAEAMVAEPIFRPLLAEISGQTSESLLRAAFAYILVYQKNPADNPWDFLGFMNDEANWKIDVPRSKLSKVLGFIADEMAKP